MPPKRGSRFKLGSSLSANTQNQRKSLPAQLEAEIKDPQNTTTHPTPSKRVQTRKSLPALRVGDATSKGIKDDSPRSRVNSTLNTAIRTPTFSTRKDRRSSKTPTIKQNMDDSAQSATTLNISSDTTNDTPFNIRFYHYKSPSSSEESRRSTPEKPTTRRRAFQSRPSRLSTVHTAAADSPRSSQGARTTRRMAALETSKNQLSDHEIPDTAEATECTYDEYMSGFGLDGAMDGPMSPTSATSGGTRTSLRVRKPTIRAMESLEQKPARRTRTQAAPKEPVKESTKEPTNEPTKEVTKTRRVSGRVTKNNKTSQYASTKTSNISKKLKTAKKPALKGLEIGVTVTSKALYELVMIAQGPEFQVPPDAQQLIADKRREFNGLRGKKDSEAQALAGTEAVAPQNEESAERAIEKFSKSSPPQLDSDGWAMTGRVNTRGEEVMLTPPGHSPYRSDHNYGDERLPAPPVRSQSDQQTESDRLWGYPPVVGNRNFPEPDSQFQLENVTATQSKMQTRENPSQNENKKLRPRKRRRTDSEIAELPTPAATPATNRDGERMSKRRRRTQPVAAPTTPSTTTKIAKTTSNSPTVTKEEKPKIQRLRLTLKPATEDNSAVEGMPAKGKVRSADTVDEAKAEQTVSHKRQRVAFKKEEEKAAPKIRPNGTSTPAARRGRRQSK